MISEKSRPSPYSAEQIIQIFNRCFREENTVLESGGNEPYYAPSSRRDLPHRLVFRQDFVASALHEIAHWCIAGERRRKLFDFGYLYFPEGRTQEEQKIFFHYEVEPQALEWIFSDALGTPFHLSADNFSPTITADFKEFERKVGRKKSQLLSEGLPPRAELFRSQLLSFKLGKTRETFDQTKSP